MRKMAIGLILFFYVSGFSQEIVKNNFLELSTGYNTGFGQGIPYKTYGSYDSTLTYLSTQYQGIGNSGFAISGKAGYAVDSNFTVIVGVTYFFGYQSVKSSSVVYQSGMVKYNWDNNFSYQFLQFNPGIRFNYLRFNPVNLFVGIGPLVDIPLGPVVNTMQDENPANSIKDMKSSRFFNLGIGAFCELGAEIKINDWIGFTFTVTADNISLAENKFVETYTQNGITYTRTITYSENPPINSNGQTASDVLNSTSTSQNFTSPLQSYNFSTIGFQIGVNLRY